MVIVLRIIYVQVLCEEMILPVFIKGYSANVTFT